MLAFLCSIDFRELVIGVRFGLEAISVERNEKFDRDLFFQHFGRFREENKNISYNLMGAHVAI
jgi:hypothetical protein